MDEDPQDNRKRFRDWEDENRESGAPYGRLFGKRLKPEDLSQSDAATAVDSPNVAAGQALTLMEAKSLLVSQLSRVFRQASVALSSVHTRAMAYNLCFEICTAGCEVDVYASVIEALQRGAKMVNEVTPYFSRSWTRCLSRAHRKMLLHLLWVFDQLFIMWGRGRAFSKDVTLKIFWHAFVGVPRIDMRRGCRAVMDTCDYLNRFWLRISSNVMTGPDAQPVAWGPALAMQVLGVEMDAWKCFDHDILF